MHGLRRCEYRGLNHLRLLTDNVTENIVVTASYLDYNRCVQVYVDGRHHGDQDYRRGGVLVPLEFLGNCSLLMWSLQWEARDLNSWLPDWSAVRDLLAEQFDEEPLTYSLAKNACRRFEGTAIYNHMCMGLMANVNVDATVTNAGSKLQDQPVRRIRIADEHISS